MRPRIHRVLTQWKPVSPRPTCVRQRTDRHDRLTLTGNSLMVVLMLMLMLV
jgi:hypothetical protein